MFCDLLDLFEVFEEGVFLCVYCALGAGRVCQDGFVSVSQYSVWCDLCDGLCDSAPTSVLVTFPGKEQAVLHPLVTGSVETWVVVVDFQQVLDAADCVSGYFDVVEMEGGKQLLRCEVVVNCGLDYGVQCSVRHVVCASGV